MIEKAKEILTKAKRIAVLTGAGISAESGLKTFRESNGLWENHSVEKVATPEGFADDPELVWTFYNQRRVQADLALPNAAHIVLARAEKTRKLTQAKKIRRGGKALPTSIFDRSSIVILTQNIDGLHQRAGSESVIELHGSLWRVRCSSCDFLSIDFPIEVPILPKCESCRALLRPDVIWFGEMLDQTVLIQADNALQHCDALLVIGTSAVVQPVASLPAIARRRGVPLIEVNPEQTALTPYTDLSLRGLAGEILPKIL